MTESRMTYENFNSNNNNVHPEEITRVHRTLDNLGGGYLGCFGVFWGVFLLISDSYAWDV